MTILIRERKLILDVIINTCNEEKLGKISCHVQFILPINFKLINKYGLNINIDHNNLIY